MIDRADIVAAQGRIATLVRRTPVLDAEVTSPDGPVPIRMKLEYLQLGGSFKIRGSLNTLAHSASGAASVVIASGGNAGIAAATAARMAGITCRVVVPEQAPPAKVDALRSLGAVVELCGTRYAEAYERASRLAEEFGAFQLHAYDQPDVVAGAGTIGLELAEQAPGPDAVLVAVGGGGLVSGIAAALAGRRIVGVEPVGAPTMSEMLRSGEVVDVDIDSVAADSLGATRLGGIAADVVTRCGVRSALVTDDAIVDARAYLWREFRIAVEWGGATALAAIRSGIYVPEPGERPVVVLCGANTDPAGLADTT